MEYMDLLIECMDLLIQCMDLLMDSIRRALYSMKKAPCMLLGVTLISDLWLTFHQKSHVLRQKSPISVARSDFGFGFMIDIHGALFIEYRALSRIQGRGIRD